MEFKGVKIVTQDQYFGWVATTEDYDGPGSPIGIGFTEQAAIDDLIEILEDQMNRLTLLYVSVAGASLWLAVFVGFRALAGWVLT